MTLRIENDLTTGLTSTGKPEKNNTAKERTFDSLLMKQLDRKEDKKLMDSCRLMEKFFLSTLMEDWGLFSVGGLFGQSGLIGQVYGDVYRDEITSRITEGRGIGLARQLYQQLSVKK